jgi:hypothetical protein
MNMQSLARHTKLKIAAIKQNIHSHFIPEIRVVKVVDLSDVFVAYRRNVEMG